MKINIRRHASRVEKTSFYESQKLLGTLRGFTGHLLKNVYELDVYAGNEREVYMPFEIQMPFLRDCFQIICPEAEHSCRYNRKRWHESFSGRSELVTSHGIYYFLVEDYKIEISFKEQWVGTIEEFGGIFAPTVSREVALMCCVIFLLESDIRMQFDTI